MNLYLRRKWVRAHLIHHPFIEVKIVCAHGKTVAVDHDIEGAFPCSFTVLHQRNNSVGSIKGATGDGCCCIIFDVGISRKVELGGELWKPGGRNLVVNVRRTILRAIQVLPRPNCFEEVKTLVIGASVATQVIALIIILPGIIGVPNIHNRFRNKLRAIEVQDAPADDHSFAGLGIAGQFIVF